MKVIKYIEDALKALDNEVESVLTNMATPMNDKDHQMLIILQQKRVLDQTLEDLKYLRDNPPKPSASCGIAKYRDDM
ncbi:MAG: hypothetical protein WC144_00600 [Sulfurimonas sp.]|jgi:hypothetical protein|nr:hypothetical protein [Sulfurimonadaceae bacterium]